MQGSAEAVRLKTMGTKQDIVRETELFILFHSFWDDGCFPRMSHLTVGEGSLQVPYRPLQRLGTDLAQPLVGTLSTLPEPEGSRPAATEDQQPQPGALRVGPASLSAVIL